MDGSKKTTSDIVDDETTNAPKEEYVVLAAVCRLRCGA
jgi:hypothetical protein